MENRIVSNRHRRRLMAILTIIVLVLLDETATTVVMGFSCSFSCTYLDSLSASSSSAVVSSPMEKLATHPRSIATTTMSNTNMNSYLDTLVESIDADSASTATNANNKTATAIPTAVATVSEPPAAATTVATITADPLLEVTTLSRTQASVHTMVTRMLHYFGAMVDEQDPEGNKFFLLSYPQTQTRVHQHCPLRELGCTWDATTTVVWYTNSLRPPIAVEQQQIVEEEDRLLLLLQNTILHTIARYDTACTNVNNTAITAATAAADNNGVNPCHTILSKTLHANFLDETPNIAHNGLLLLALLGWERCLASSSSVLSSSSTPAIDHNNNFEELTNGILCMQREDGAFRTYFGANDATKDDGHDDDKEVQKGIEFFSGEAMTALMEVYASCTITTTTLTMTTTSRNHTNQRLFQLRIRTAMIRALHYYRRYYEDGVRDGTIDVNYTIWQTQAFSRLFLILHQDRNEHETMVAAATIAAAEYCLDMCNAIIRSPSWKILSRGTSFYSNLSSTLEIACGLDALIQGIRVAYHYQQYYSTNDDTITDSHNYHDCYRLFARNIENAIDYLEWSQNLGIPDNNNNNNNNDDHDSPKEMKIGYGGLGYGNGGIQMTEEQRLDITGHAVSALVKVLQLNDDTLLLLS